MRRHSNPAVVLVVLLGLITLLVPMAFAPERVYACSMPYVSGTSIYTCGGVLLVLHGISQPSALNNKNAWDSGQRPATDANSPLDAATINAMSSWGVNMLRVPVSAYIYNEAPTAYLAQIDTLISNTLTPNMKVIFALFDDAKAGSPYTPEDRMHQEDLTFLGVLAQRYAAKTRVFYDLLNEPNESSWSAWQTDMQAGINAVRQYSQQVIILEPTHGVTGNGCKTGSGYAIKGQFNTLPSSDMPTDPNTVYSPHMYNAVVNGDAQSWQCEMGPAYGNHPEYVGEWGVLPHANSPYDCQNLTSMNADSVTNTWLNWSLTGNAGARVDWSAWDFEPIHMIQDQYTTYTPTTFATGTWTCDDDSTAANQAGMGSDVKSWLASH